jgi:hypothetical protein
VGRGEDKRERGRGGRGKKSGGARREREALGAEEFFIEEVDLSGH